MNKQSVLETLQHWAEIGLLRAVDYQFAKLLAAHGQKPLADNKEPLADNKEPLTDMLILLAALTSHELATGNVCLPLEYLQQPEKRWPPEMLSSIKQQPWSELSSLAEAQPAFLADANKVFEPKAPLVLQRGRVYLYRYWHYEVQVAAAIVCRAETIQIDQDLLKRSLAELFANNSEQEGVDWQKVAAAISVQKRFAVISGGPGTGKTTTVIKLLALYIEQQLALGKTPQIKLAAPTGKAAARLSESITDSLARFTLSESFASYIPTQASTLHRLLGVIPNSIEFRHNAANPLHLDMLIVDEASMIDLPMMARLLAALPEQAQVVFLGDRDQLASVEAGSVLADICSWPGQLNYSSAQHKQLQDLGCLPLTLEQQQGASKVADTLSLLRKSYRFDEKSGIGFLAKAVNQGDRAQFERVCQQGFADLDVLELNSETYEQLLQQLVDFYAELIASLCKGVSTQAIIQRLGECQLLCALREGPYGVAGVNHRVRQGLASRGLIPVEGTWFNGRPIMISQNDASLNLFNGDIGITLADSEGCLKVWFMQNGELCSYLPSRIPEHDTVFAMTTHKSQGSEFTQALLLLPSNDVQVLTRELLYTAITRAKKKLTIYGPAQLMKLAITRKTQRAGGLVDRLWNSKRSIG